MWRAPVVVICMPGGVDSKVKEAIMGMGAFVADGLGKIQILTIEEKLPIWVQVERKSSEGSSVLNCCTG